MNKKLTMIIAGLTVVGLFGAAPVKAFFQADPRDQIIPSIELDQADVRDALRLLFKQVNVDYTVDSAVQGTVTVKLTNQPFETVLRNILGQVNSTWRVEGNVYSIVTKPNETPTPGDTQDVPPPTATRNPPVRIKIRHADPAYIIAMINAGTTPGDNTYPEMSTMNVPNLGGGGGQGGGGFGGGNSGGGFGGGSSGGFGGGNSGGGFGGGSSGGFGGGGSGGGFGGRGGGF